MDAQGIANGEGRNWRRYLSFARAAAVTTCDGVTGAEEPTIATVCAPAGQLGAENAGGGVALTRTASAAAVAQQLDFKFELTLTPSEERDKQMRSSNRTCVANPEAEKHFQGIQ